MQIKSSYIYATLVIVLIFFSSDNSVLSQSNSTDTELEDTRVIGLLDGLRNDTVFIEQGSSVTGVLYVNADESKIETNYIEVPSDTWQFTIIPYLWMMSINGETTIKGRSADLDASFGDIWDNLDFASEIHFEVWRDRYGFFLDTSFAKIALKRNVSLRNDKNLSTKFVTKFFLGELGGFYRVGTWPLNGNTKSYERKTKTSITLDLIGGGRYWYLKNSLDINDTSGEFSEDVSDSQNWFDFFVGGRVKLDINKFFVQLRSDIGGFGLGFSSDFAWNIAGYLGYELPWYRITPLIGYRALYDKYEDGSGDNRFVWDAWISGPQIGVGFQF